MPTVSKWQSVSKSNPCQICGKTDYCSISNDGQFAGCRRNESGSFKTKTDRSGVLIYLHRLPGSTAPPKPPPSSSGSIERADVDTLHEVYSALLAALPISKAHREALNKRGLTDDEIEKRGYASLAIKGRAKLAKQLQERFSRILHVPGFYFKENDGKRFLSIAGAAGILIPVRTIDGKIVALMVRRDGEGDGPKYSFLSSKNKGGQALAHRFTFHSELPPRLRLQD